MTPEKTGGFFAVAKARDKPDARTSCIARVRTCIVRLL
jgi:hypothetical protein